MKRLLYKELIKWKSQDKRKPLLLQGARQTGKTYLLKEFARNEYTDLAYFNFEQTTDLSTLFDSTLDSNVLIQSLGAYLGRKIHPESTLVFFDEIQACPRAITSLKYFCENAPEYHIVSAGSLLGVSVGKSTSFPVGKVNFLTLYSMSFCEYLMAMGEEMLVQLMEEKKIGDTLPELIHDKLTRLFKYYLYIGGMPEVVQSYVDKQDIEEVRSLQEDILAAYERDFSKYSSASEAIRVSEVWHSIPAQLARENKKFKYSEVVKSGRASKFETAVEWLRRAGLIYKIYNLTVPKLPLSGYTDHSKFKIYTLDSGLLGAMLEVPSQIIIEGDRLFSEYNGAFIENCIARELISSFRSEELYYWTSASEAEVDFVLHISGEVFPLEVKSGLSGKAKSLKVYTEKYNPVKVFRASPRNFKQDGNFINVPLYGVSVLTKILTLLG